MELLEEFLATSEFGELDEFVVDEGNAFKDEGEDATFESIVKDMRP